jgi:uncharacterized membrane protein YheB (UPF0754 family)
MTIQQSVNQVLSIAGLLGRGIKSNVEETAKAKTKEEAVTKKAQDALKKEQERRRKTRRNFLNYMKEEPTNLGVKFGELDVSLQKELAKDYTKSQRKKIMDRMDAMK